MALKKKHWIKNLKSLVNELSHHEQDHIRKHYDSYYECRLPECHPMCLLCFLYGPYHGSRVSKWERSKSIFAFLFENSISCNLYRGFFIFFNGHQKKKTAHCHLSNQRNTLRSRDNCCRKLLFQSCNISTAVSLVGAETWNQNLQMARWVLCHHSTSRSKSFFFFLMSNFTNR